MTITAIEGYLKLFSAFPVMYSVYIPAGEPVALPLQCDLSPATIDMLSQTQSLVLLGGRYTKAELSTPEKEQFKQKVRAAQYKVSLDSDQASAIAHEILTMSLQKKVALARRFVDLLPELEVLQEELESTEINRTHNPRWKTFMFADEAGGADTYFRMFGRVCEHLGWEFNKRSRRPAQNPVNAMLNYGYAILKSAVDKLVLISGLDPYVGFLHSIRAGRESLSLDLMEPFRQSVVDTSVLELLHTQIVKEDMFEVRRDEVRLSDKAKDLLVGRINEKLFFGAQPAITAISKLLEVTVDAVISFSRAETMGK